VSCRDGPGRTASTPNTASADAPIVIVALTMSSVIADDLRSLRSAPCSEQLLSCHYLDDAAKQTHRSTVVPIGVDTSAHRYASSTLGERSARSA
jgi:hypothetical protein